jgi:hypothetical protein
MSIYGPNVKSNGTDPVGNVDLSLYAKKAQVLSKMGGRMTGRINMQNKKITNLADPTELQDAATEGSVRNYASHLNNVKVSKAGDTMTGNLDMSDNKITNLANPERDKDSTTKEYVDTEINRHWHKIELKSVGRYIVFPNGDDSNTYFSVRNKKNIDLNDGTMVTIKYDQISDDLNVDYNMLVTTVTKSTTTIRNPDKTLGTFTLTDMLSIRFRRSNPAPWTLIFSAKLGNPSNSQRNGTMLDFDQNKTLKFEWDRDSFTYSFMVNETVHFFKAVQVNTNKFHHFTFKYANRKLTFFLNGEQIKEHNAPDINRLVTILLGFEEMGLLYFYNRSLTRLAIAEHFMDYHVENFTDGNSKVLI